MTRRQPAGTEPANARSPLRLRLALAGFGAVVCALATVWLVAFARSHEGSARTVSAVLAGVALAAAVVAVVDAVVIIRRRRSDTI